MAQHGLVVVQEVVIQVGQLFLQPVAAAGAPLLVKQAGEDMSSGELLFSPLPGQDRSQEAEAWQVQLGSQCIMCPAGQSRLSVLPLHVCPSVYFKQDSTNCIECNRLGWHEKLQDC